MYLKVNLSTRKSCQVIVSQIMKVNLSRYDSLNSEKKYLLQSDMLKTSYTKAF